MKNKYICPVCGYNKLAEPPYDEFNTPSCNICPCCNCEYGYDDWPFEQARKRWTNSKKFKQKHKEQLLNLENEQVELLINNVNQEMNKAKKHQQ